MGCACALTGYFFRARTLSCATPRPQALSESGAADEVIISIAGRVSRAMLSRYSYVRMEAERRALDEIAAGQRAADERRKKEERQQAAVACQSAAVQ
jgi:hypothetical protein